MERTLIINQQAIKLTITKQLEICSKCQTNSEIRLISQRNNLSKEYCLACSLKLLEQLEASNLQFADKKLVIKELRTELNKKLWADYYSVKKPYCVPCLQLGIKEAEYRLCGNSCLVANYLHYHSSNFLSKKNQN